MDKATEKTKKNKKKKPLRRAKHWGTQVLPMAGRLAVLLIAIVVLGLMFSALQGVGSAWLRVALSVLIVSGLLLLCLNEGMTHGAQDALASRNYVSLEAKGIALEDKDDAACYQPLKAVCAAAVVYSVPLLLSLLIAATAKEYTYTLQDLPAWLTSSYGTRGDVMAPLAAYAGTSALGALDIVRMIVRMLELLFVNLFADPLTMGAAIDRLSPLMLLTYPAAYILGYLSAPARSAKESSMNRKAKKAAVRKASRSHLAEELVGKGGEVHYGQKADEEKKKRRELI